MNAVVNRRREVERLQAGMPTSDGAGVRLLRVLTQELQRRLDPFLMLDEFRSDNPDDYIAGFPDHPHRGFQTVTYMLDGRMRHRDSHGNEGLLGPGGVQWMNAGRGLVHSELPEQADGLMHGFQLWINLPAARKMSEPGYRDIPASAIPQTTTAGGVTIKVIAGEADGLRGAVQEADTEPLYLDLELPAGATHSLPLPPSHNAFVYVYAGEATIGGRTVGEQRLAVLGNDPAADGVTLSTVSGARVLVLAGRPLGEPIAQWGPFVMNSRGEVEQAIDDFRNGRF